MSAEPTQPDGDTEPPGAAAPPDPAASGEGETSFADAQGPPEPPDRGAPEFGLDDEDLEAPEAAAEPEPGSAEAELERAGEPAAEEARRYLALAQRTQADFENFRRRATREQAAASARGKAGLAKEILPALDHLDLALSAAERDPAAAEFARGVRLVQDELLKALGRAGIEAFSPLHEAFDPVEHEAMASQPVEGLESGQVAEVYQPGYRLGETVLRPARVVVAA